PNMNHTYPHYTHVTLLIISAGPHRHLPSFPTRRSSDLPHQLSPECDRLRGMTAPDIRLVVADLDGTLLDEHKQMPDGTLDLDVGDRKSTRLNSSHVKISYAVFCLKKKKRTETNQSR